MKEISIEWAAKSKAAMARTSQQLADLHLMENIQKWLESAQIGQKVATLLREFGANASTFSREFASRLRKMQTRELLIAGGALMLVISTALVALHVRHANYAKVPHQTPVESIPGVLSQQELAAKGAHTVVEVKMFEVEINTATKITEVNTETEKRAAQIQRAALRAKAQKDAAAVNANLIPMPTSIPLPVGSLASARSQSLGNLGGTAFVAPKTVAPVVHLIKTVGPDDKYFDVGSFKETSWADRATGIIKGLGFETHVQRKSKLWMNSYHVIVGPFATQEQADAAKKALETNGFKPHLTKLD